MQRLSAGASSSTGKDVSSVSDSGGVETDAHLLSTKEVLSALGVDQERGLSDAQVEARRVLYGTNELASEPATPLLTLIARQFEDLLVRILIFAAAVSFALAVVDANGRVSLTALVEPGVIVLILIANAAVGVVTETHAERAIEELKSYTAELATVIRGGKMRIVRASELVPGDIVEVAVGSKVPADCRIIALQSTSFRVDQSILTGESGSVLKDSEPCNSLVGSRAMFQDKTNTLFSGTVATSGRARAIVVGTGSKTAIGQIRDSLAENTNDMTPMKKKLEEFGNFLSRVIAVICILVWVVNIRNFADKTHGGVLRGAIYYFKIAVALAVAAIPEGLPAVVTTCLALGTKKMAAKNAIVRTLTSVETLGCTTVICTDKTGTITTNQMSVSRICVLGEKNGILTEDDYSVSGSTYAPDGIIRESVSNNIVPRPAAKPSLAALAKCASLCNEATIQCKDDEGVYTKIGEPTEVALKCLVEKIGLPEYTAMPSALARLHPSERVQFCNHRWEVELKKIFTLEFSRDRKMMSVLVENLAFQKSEEEWDFSIFTKGAPENVITQCSRYICNTSGKVIDLTKRLRSLVLAKVETYGNEGTLRCLALAMKPLKGVSKRNLVPEDESDLTFIGVVAMLDPPRDEIRIAVQKCREAGIRVIVVTGDNKSTAESVCRKVGIIDDKSNIDLEAGHTTNRESMTGAEFESLCERDRESAYAELSLLSRVEPAHKARLVGVLKQHGHIVAMTGDGVNDAPALKKSDIGIAMGSGTAVAKNVADMVLADDNFATIVDAIAEGRAIFNNTKQFIRYMVSSNIGEVVCIFVAAALGLPETLLPVQLLWVNLVTDGLPATALGFNKPDRDIMRKGPRRADEGIVNSWLFIRYLVIGVYVGLVTVGGYIWWFTGYVEGPKLTWAQLASFESCTEESATADGYSCSIFESRHPNTIAMSVLVTVEMFNALNALSENQSLLIVRPWSNMWLLSAISLSFLLHFAILYLPILAQAFSVTSLSLGEWKAILKLSFPVVLVDEVLKFLSRRGVRTTKGGKNL